MHQLPLQPRLQLLKHNRLTTQRLRPSLRMDAVIDWQLYSRHQGLVYELYRSDEQDQGLGELL